MRLQRDLSLLTTGLSLLKAVVALCFVSLHPPKSVLKYSSLLPLRRCCLVVVVGRVTWHRRSEVVGVESLEKGPVGVEPDFLL